MRTDYSGTVTPSDVFVLATDDRLRAIGLDC
jgi:hypothetical protein